jgi:hypothetical protein
MKELKLLILFTFLVNLSIAQIVNFENVSLERKSSIQASFGLNMAAMANLEYGRTLSIKENPFILSANATLPFGENILDDYRLAINLSSNTFKKGNWAMPAHLGLFATTTENKMNRMVSSGIHISINPGYYKKSWFVATEITYDKFLFSHIKNSKHYKEVYYSEAKDGWYKNTGGNFHFGLIAGKSLKKGELNIKLGMITTEQLNLVLVSYYAQVGYRIYF